MKVKIKLANLLSKRPDCRQTHLLAPKNIFDKPQKVVILSGGNIYSRASTNTDSIVIVNVIRSSTTIRVRVSSAEDSQIREVQLKHTAASHHVKSTALPGDRHPCNVDPVLFMPPTWFSCSTLTTAFGSSCS